MSKPVKKTSPWPVLEFIIKAGLVCICIGFFAWIAPRNFIGPPRSGPEWNANGCINNLRQIDAAKQQWALENGKTNGDIIATESDIMPYLGRGPKGNFPHCPSGGQYVIGKLNQPPACSLGTNVNPPHVLP